MFAVHSPDSRLLSASPGTTVAAVEAAGGGLRRREDDAVSAPLLPDPLFRNASEIPKTIKQFSLAGKQLSCANVVFIHDIGQRIPDLRL